MERCLSLTFYGIKGTYKYPLFHKKSVKDKALSNETKLIFCSSIFTVEKRVKMSLLEKKRFVSTVNMMGSKNVETLERWFTQIKDIKGPDTETCWTPQVMSAKAVFLWSYVLLSIFKVTLKTTQIVLFYSILF